MLKRSFRCTIVFIILLIILSLSFIMTGCNNDDSTDQSTDTTHIHTEEIIPQKSPTCYENGSTEGKKCSVCDTVLVEPQVVLAKHTEQTIPQKSPTCYENGSTEGKKCSVCDTVLVEPQVILAKHTEQTIPRVEPSVAKTGYTEGKKCSVCKEMLVQPCEISLLSIEIDEQDSIVGKISCSLMLEQVSGEFSVYYANKDKQRLPYYNKLSDLIADTENNCVEIDDLILPSACEYIIATDNGEYVYFVKIPDKYLFSQKNYTFGSLSDVHSNNGDYFDGALDFFDDYGEIDFVAISGDISDGAEKDLLWFNETIKDRLYKVYTTTGNHDQNSLNSGRWLEYMNTGISTDTEVVNIGENGLDFVFIPQKSAENVFVFLSQTKWYYPSMPTGDEYSILAEEQLVWLEEVLEIYKDKTVFLYFHTFLSAPDGSQESAVGNLRNPGGYSYDLPYSYGTADEVAFRALMKKYKNVVYFSGHSHWMFELEKYNENLNMSNFDGEYCYMVHNSSVCSPRWIGEQDTYRQNMTGERSEGWIVEVYDEAIVLIPVDFILGVFYTEYMKIIPLS